MRCQWYCVQRGTDATEFTDMRIVQDFESDGDMIKDGNNMFVKI